MTETLRHLTQIRKFMSDRRRVVKNSWHLYEDADGHSISAFYLEGEPIRACLRGWCQYVTGEWHGDVEVALQSACCDLGILHPTDAVRNSKHIDVIDRAIEVESTGATAARRIGTT